MRRSISNAGTLVLCAALGVAGCADAEAELPSLREYRSEAVHLAHPPSWVVTYDTFDLHSDDSHFVALRSDADGALLVSIFGGETDIALETFAARYASHLDASAASASHSIATAPRSVGRVEARIFGRLHSGLLQDFTLARGFARQARRMAIFKVARDDREYFIVANARRSAWPRTFRDVEQILASLRPEPRFVAADLPGVTPAE